MASDADFSRRVTPEEYQAATEDRFRLLDRNGDGALTREELAQFVDRGPLDASTQADVRRGLGVIEQRAEGLNRFLRGYATLARLPPPTVRDVEVRALVARVVALESSPAVTVADSDRVTVDGRPIPTRPATRLWRYHKPRGRITTARDPQGRPTVFDDLPADMPRVVTVGRLDLDSEGLLLLTNDGALKRRLELPATGWTRRYRVRVRGRVDPAALAALSNGITIDGIRYGPVRAALERQDGGQAWLIMSLTEGKKREVRRICEHLGWPVSRLIRIAYGPFQIGSLPPGAVAEVPAKVLREQLGVFR